MSQSRDNKLLQMMLTAAVDAGVNSLFSFLPLSEIMAILLGQMNSFSVPLETHTNSINKFIFAYTADVECL